MLHGDGAPDFTKRSMVARTDVDACIGRGRRQQLRMMRGAALDIGHDPLGFRFAAMRHEPARAFRNGVAQKNYDQAEDRADGECHPPAKADGNDAGIKQRDHGSRADGCADPEAGVNDEVNATANARGDKFVDGGVDGGIFTANARAGKRAKKRVRSKVPGESRERGGAEIEQQGDGEQALAAETVSEVTKKKRASDRADEIKSCAGADLCVSKRERILALEHSANSAGKRDFKTVEHPGDAERDHDEPVPAAPGQTVEPRRNVT